MANFLYIVSNVRGESVRGNVSANDKNELARKLKDKGLFLVSCKLEESLPPGNSTPRAPMIPAPRPMLHLQSGASASPARAAASAPESAPRMSSSSSSAIPQAHAWFSSVFRKQNQGPGTGSPKGKVPLKELVVFTRQISISINAGMSFIDALQSMASTSRNPKMTYVLRRVLEDILSGKKFSDALAEHPDIF